MKLETLEYIVTTSQCSSITAAAEKLFLSQTSLSSAIRSIEAEVGIQIFERSRNGLVVTEQGQEFLEIAEQICDLHKQMLTIPSKNKKPNLTLRLVANASACNHYSIPISCKFNQCLPNITLAITEAPRDQIPLLLANEQYDFGIGCFYLDEEDSFYRQVELAKLCCEPLTTFHTYVYVGPQNRFYDCKSVDLESLRGEHLALSESGLSEYHKTKSEDFFPNHTIFNGGYMVRRAVESNNMISLYLSTDQPSDWFTENSSIRKLAITKGGFTPTRHCLLYRKRKRFTSAEQALLKCIRETIKN